MNLIQTGAGKTYSMEVKGKMLLLFLFLFLALLSIRFLMLLLWCMLTGTKCFGRWWAKKGATTKSNWWAFWIFEISNGQQEDHNQDVNGSKWPCPHFTVHNKKKCANCLRALLCVIPTFPLQYEMPWVFSQKYLRIFPTVFLIWLQFVNLGRNLHGESKVRIPSKF